MRFVVGLLLTLLLSGAAGACPACLGRAGTMVDSFDTGEGVALAQQVNKGSYRLLEVFQGPLKAGTVLSGPPQGRERVIFVAPPPGAPFWATKLYPATPETVAFARKLCALPPRLEPGAEPARLRFLADYLEHPEREISDAANAEYALSSWSGVTQMAPKIGKARLKHWLSARSTPAEHRPLYFVLYSRLADPSDLPFLESELQRVEKRREAPESSALIVCYLRVRGAAGVPRVESLARGKDPGRKLQMLQGLRVAVNDAGILPARAVLPAFRRQLNTREVAPTVLEDLTRWKDWDSLGQVLSLYENTSELWIRMAAVRYLKACPLPRARQALAKIRKEEPSLLP